MAIIDDYADIAQRRESLGRRDYDGAPDRSQPAKPPQCGQCWDHGWIWDPWDQKWLMCLGCGNKAQRDEPQYKLARLKTR